ncbi:hypothetical protein C8R43DRAFT_1239001 [Mycena crocata]|nr:hypothetical protein C8R43DRAFT_1239001 [Mycena crocata]
MSHAELRPAASPHNHPRKLSPAPSRQRAFCNRKHWQAPSAGLEFGPSVSRTHNANTHLAPRLVPVPPPPPLLPFPFPLLHRSSSHSHQPTPSSPPHSTRLGIILPHRQVYGEARLVQLQLNPANPSTESRVRPPDQGRDGSILRLTCWGCLIPFCIDYFPRSSFCSNLDLPFFFLSFIRVASLPSDSERVFGMDLLIGVGELWWRPVPRPVATIATVSKLSRSVLHDPPTRISSPSFSDCIVSYTSLVLISVGVGVGVVLADEGSDVAVEDIRHISFDGEDIADVVRACGEKLFILTRSFTGSQWARPWKRRPGRTTTDRYKRDLPLFVFMLRIFAVDQGSQIGDILQIPKPGLEAFLCQRADPDIIAKEIGFHNAQEELEYLKSGLAQEETDAKDLREEYPDEETLDYAFLTDIVVARLCEPQAVTTLLATSNPFCFCQFSPSFRIAFSSNFGRWSR